MILLVENYLTIDLLWIQLTFELNKLRHTWYFISRAMYQIKIMKYVNLYSLEINC